VEANDIHVSEDVEPAATEASVRSTMISLARVTG
jgi:hypothetical protein